MNQCSISGCSCTYASSTFTVQPPGGAKFIGKNPLCLDNFLAAGCIQIKAHPTTIDNRHSSPTHGQGILPYWRPLTAPIPDFRQHLCDPDDDVLYGELEFLLKNQFIASTYSLETGWLLLRIYLIPYDLSSVRGCLRTRREEIIASARRCLKGLLPRVNQDRRLWSGDISCAETVSPLLASSDNRTLAEIYGDMVSPQPAVWPDCPEIASRLLNFDDGLKDAGMHTSLFKYQRRSVAAMLQQELDTRDHKDPLYVELRGIDDKIMYYQPAKMELLQDPPMIAKCRGGILCEELGTGKTVMVLALILSTLNQLSTPEVSIVDNERPVLTPVAFRHFPSTLYATARARALRRQKACFDDKRPVPSLVELMLHHARLNPSFEAMERWEDALGANLLPLLKANAPFFCDHGGEPSNMERTKRAPSNIGPRIMYLTTATLLVVPQNLLAQWQSEIYKHVATPLRIFVAISGMTLPRANILATEYDIVLMSYDKLSAEASSADTSRLHSWNLCQCPESRVARVPTCVCVDPGVTPVLQIRWKRMVIDEGHTSGAINNSLSHFARILSVERKWVVTGTPSKNLLGLSFGTASDDVSFEDESFNESDNAGTLEINAEDVNGTRRIWTKHDAEDLRRLSVMLRNFISVPVFKFNPSLFFSQITEALLDKDGPRLGATAALSQIFQTYMIRHRIEEIEHEVVLPPLSKSSILLDLEAPALRSLNSLQAILAINAVDSEREHQDYMFHSRNTKVLAQVVENMSQIMFWSVDTGLYNVDELSRSSAQFFERAWERKVSDEDMTLLTSAFGYVTEASHDHLWRDINSYEDIPYLVYNLDEEIFQAWTRTPDTTQGSGTRRQYLHADRISKLYEKIKQFPLARKAQIVEWGKELAAEEAAYKAMLEQSKLKRKGQSQGNNETESVLVSFMSHIGSAKVKEVQQDLQVALNKLDHGAGSAIVNDAAVNALANAQTSEPTLLCHSVLKDVMIGSSGSSKLNYILEEVQKYAADEKFLIFSASPLTLAHVAEGLELLRVKYLQFSTRVPPRIREQFVMTFETSDTYRVFLMDLKHGARGLNLVSASRIIFCEPIWHADVESQAIKRAHRIGQTKPITVKILAIRGTAEEYMSQRRQVLKDRAEKVSSMTNEVGMRDFIAHPKFLGPCSIASNLRIPLISGAGSTTMEQYPIINVNSEDVYMESVSNVQNTDLDVTTNTKEERSCPSPPKKRRVAFAD